MRIFEAVGRTGSFTRAAERLNLTQSAVSRQVRNLEDELGEPLLIRHHHRLELTPAGARLLKAIGRALQEVESAVRSIGERADTSRLRLNVPPTFAKRWLLPRLPSLRAAHPDLELSVTTQPFDRLLESGVIDCAVRFGDGQWQGVAAHRLMTERHIAVSAPALKADGVPFDPRDHTLLHVLADTDRRYLTWAHWLDAAGFDPGAADGGLEFDLLDLVIEAACRGLGAAVADSAMVETELREGRLVKLLDVEIEGHESYWLVTRADEPEPPKVRQLRTWLTAEIAGG
ncbi:LysR family transcriptional regulator [Rhizobiales bacterium Sp-1]|uniref:LysR family transcriptional regulator n=2 Tax=Segnochrobactrum spirostomi TaxID=2608987 RepID=A0A6A7Y4R0_9HYPH|nr:LysR family transcriptional regulator [Segnochrobactrum spirostomi]